jgi:5'-nucleotidase
LRSIDVVSSIARMTRTHGLPVLFLISLGLGVALLGCDSGSSGSAGSGGTAGTGGSGGSGEQVLRVLITNDDGIDARGINAVVEALKDDPTVSMVISAPSGNRSGSGDSTVETNPGLCGTGAAMPSSTLSGYDTDTWAVDGCPADCVIYALANLYPDQPPHVVLSGINDGQNVGNVNGVLSQISGTIGAAKTGACLGVPALATSQGESESPDFDSGVAALMVWLDDNRAALLAGEVSLENITSINIPTCDTGSIRGTVETVLATENPDGIPLNGPQDCESDLENPQDDVEAFFNGFISITGVPSNSSNTCDGLN